MDRTTCLFAKTRVNFGMVQVEFAVAKEVKLVDSEAEFPGNVSPVDWSRGEFLGFVLFCSSGRGHGIVLKY